jgi:hypothetical protein
MGTGFLIGAIDETFEKIVVGSDPWGIVGEKAGKDGKERKGAGLLDPLGDAGDFKEGHEDKGSEHFYGIARGAPFYRGIEAFEEFSGRIKVKMSQDNELFGIGFEGFPELTIRI